MTASVPPSSEPGLHRRYQRRRQQFGPDLVLGQTHALQTGPPVPARPVASTAPVSRRTVAPAATALAPYVNCGGTDGLRHHLSEIKTTNRIVVYDGTARALLAVADDASATSCA